jgi:hypothetical protein
MSAYISHVVKRKKNSDDGLFPLTTADEPAEQPNQGAADDCMHSSSTQFAGHFVHSTV